MLILGPFRTNSQKKSQNKAYYNKMVFPETIHQREQCVYTPAWKLNTDKFETHFFKNQFLPASFLGQIFDKGKECGLKRLGNLEIFA